MITSNAFCVSSEMIYALLSNLAHFYDIKPWIRSPVCRLIDRGNKCQVTTFTRCILLIHIKLILKTAQTLTLSISPSQSTKTTSVRSPKAPPSSSGGSRSSGRSPAPARPATCKWFRSWTPELFLVSMSPPLPRGHGKCCVVALRGLPTWIQRCKWTPVISTIKGNYSKQRPIS